MHYSRAELSMAHSFKQGVLFFKSHRLIQDHPIKDF